MKMSGQQLDLMHLGFRGGMSEEISWRHPHEISNASQGTEETMKDVTIRNEDRNKMDG